MSVAILYKNYKGTVKVMNIRPLKMWHGSTQYYPQKQWLLDVQDVDRGVQRTLAMKSIRVWDYIL